jgi:hypothetical protein
MRNNGFSRRCRIQNSSGMLHAMSHDKVLPTLRRDLGLLSLTMKIKALLSFETPITVQQWTRRNIPERQFYGLAISPQIRPRPPLYKSFLGAFTKLRKATIIFVMSVRMEQLSFH